ncbi:hypothetical protein E2562_026061 [Oryza meyeriana var. granulata]|uniref:Uncharacterized protein n=1 Tax=Oryza meyeriana var. granulata TaxID=110450 RepID=A0A6G1E2N3_9ORYZ|nr:hypothetical protein E2562_026061 [Oryza meyeriana var. granulata]
MDGEGIENRGRGRQLWLLRSTARWRQQLVRSTEQRRRRLRSMAWQVVAVAPDVEAASRRRSSCTSS